MYCGPITYCVTGVLCLCTGPLALLSVFCPCDEVENGHTTVIHGGGNHVDVVHHNVIHDDPYGYETGLIAGAVTGAAIGIALNDIGHGGGGDWGGDGGDYGGDCGGDSGGDFGGD